MAAFLGSQDPLNTPMAPSLLPGVHEHAAASLLYSTRGSNNLAHASTMFPKRIPLLVLDLITNGFSKDRELGIGAFGKVYKGVYDNGETIAVKLLYSKPGLDDEKFEKEFRNLTSLRHKNIVRLVGFCHETQREFVLHNGKMIFADAIHMALCFEYMHNGSLDKYLFDEYSGHNWPTRYAIIKGICEGLKYLHEESKPPIYHLDLKPANILLDDNMMPKIADFGLSRFFGLEKTRITESSIGTLGYLPPEYIESNIISNKLDIFSLGVIIIKIISGPTGYTQCDEMPPNQFIELVHQKWRTRLQALEPYSGQVMRCIEMALSCVEKERRKRPCIGDIIDKLNELETNEQGSSKHLLSVDICSTSAQASLPPAASYSPPETINTKGVGRLREHIGYAMGDLVIGLAKSVVQGAVTKVQSAIEEEAKLRQSAQRDLVFITGEFQMMQSFLNIADKERVKNKVVRTWVRQMRELAYEMEDWIEFVVGMHRTNGWSILFPPCIASPQPLDVAAGEIEELKARVVDVSTRNMRYGLISDSGSKPVLTQQHPAAHDAVGYDTRRQHVLGDLTKLITKKDDTDLQVISVWGAGGGIGTTAIIRKSYSDPEISHSFTCRAWVNLTHPFNPYEFVRSLMAHLYGNSYQERRGEIVGIDVLTSMDAIATQGDFLSEFVQLVNKNRYLVVLEDVATMAEWDSIRMFLPDRKNGSCIIVSSPQYEIASLCVGHPYQVLNLKQLPAGHVCAFLREGSQEVGEKSNAVNDSTWTSRKEISTDRELSHNQNSPTDYHRISNSKKKAARDWMQNSPLVGCRLKDQLCYYTVQAQMNHSQVMSVWGIPGVGKSSLVRTLYYDQILENQQFQEYSWVGLSQTQPFDLRDFCQSLLLDFQSEYLQAEETAPSHSMSGIKECCELLSTRQCLVIIDGLQSTEEWDLIQSTLVPRHSGSKTLIIVITTTASIATYCADKEELVLHVKPLEADAAFDLLKNEVSKKTPFPASLSYRENAVLRELVSVCGGLPLIIVTMARILGTNVVGWMDTASSIRLRFMRELETNPEFDSLWDLFTWMHACFRACPDSVMPCMFSVSFFPGEHNIRRQRLIRRWIAEGYSRYSDEQSAEDNGEEIFSNLLNLSIIQQPPQSDSTAFSDIRMVSCRVNGFFRECIHSQGMEENLVFELAHTSSLTTQRTGRHLVISESWDRDRIVFESMDFSRLRSMTVFGNWTPFFISKSMKMLRVLDLEDAVGVTDDDVDQMVKLFPRLKFLSLRGCQGIFHLPRSLGNLRQLQTLDVRNTSIITLPATISRLHNLQYIRGGISTIAAKGKGQGSVEVPSGIGKLTALHTLGVINIGASKGEAILKMLKNLTQLRKLGVFGINRKNSGPLSSAISSHVHLGSLSVWLDKESGGCLDDICLPLENLQSLKLYGLTDRLPGLQVNELSKLAKVHLEMATIREEDIEILGMLPKLCILRLRVEVLEDGRLQFHVFSNGLEEPSYLKLKVLDIACRSSLHVTFGSETMRKLELLKVEYCSGSSYQLSGLDHLSELREVWLNGSYEETQKQYLEGQLANHPRKPELKLEEEIPCSST
ncbi:unnamed protein product [Alopecurus aequalis]